MSSKFTAVELTGHRYVVTGTDVIGNTGKVVLDGTEWAGIKRHDAAHKAEAEYDEAVNKFFAPMVAAQEKLDAILAGSDDEDPIEYMVLHEAVEATPGHKEVRAHLSKDSQVLRLIEDNDTDRLLWVTESTLEITKAGTNVAAVIASSTSDPSLFDGAEVPNSPFGPTE